MSSRVLRRHFNFDFDKKDEPSSKQSRKEVLKRGKISRKEERRGKISRKEVVKRGIISSIVADLISNEKNYIKYLRSVLQDYRDNMDDKLYKKLLPWAEIDQKQRIFNILDAILKFHHSHVYEVLNKYRGSTIEIGKKFSLWGEEMISLYTSLLDTVPKGPILIHNAQRTNALFELFRKKSYGFVPLMNIIQWNISNCLQGFKELDNSTTSLHMLVPCMVLGQICERLDVIPDNNSLYGYGHKKFQAAGKLIWHLPCRVGKHIRGTIGEKAKWKDLFVFENVILFCEKKGPLLYKYLYSLKKKNLKITKVPGLVCLSDKTSNYFITAPTDDFTDACSARLEKLISKQ